MNDVLRVRRFERRKNLNRKLQKFSESSGLRAMRSRSVSPSSNSMAINGWPSASSTS